MNNAQYPATAIRGYIKGHRLGSLIRYLC